MKTVEEYAIELAARSIEDGAAHDYDVPNLLRDPAHIEACALAESVARWIRGNWPALLALVEREATPAHEDLTGPERAALDAWNSVSPDMTGMLFAVRAALWAAERERAAS